MAKPTSLRFAASVLALLLRISFPAAGQDLHGLRQRERLSQELRQKLDALPPETAAHLLSFVQAYSSDPSQQDSALETALTAAQAAQQLSVLRQLGRDGRLSDEELRRGREAAFQRLDSIMIDGMSIQMHRVYMAQMREPLRELGYDLASRHAVRWKRKDPGADSYAYAAGLSLDSGNFRAALQEAQQSLRADPGGKTAAGIVADASYRLGRYEVAQAAAKRLLELDPGNVQAMTILRLIADRSAPVDAPSADPEAGLTAPPAPASDPGMDQAAIEQSRRFYESARESLKDKLYPAAIQNAGKAIQLDPKNWAALFVRARALVEQGNWGDAFKDSEQALRLAPADKAGMLLALHALILARMEDYRTSLEYAGRAISAGATANAYVAKAWALAGLHRRPEALDALRTAMIQNSQYEVLYRRAQEMKSEDDLTSLFQTNSSIAAPTAPPAGADWLKPLAKAILPRLGIVAAILLILGLIPVFAGRRPQTTRRRTADARNLRERPPLAPSGLIAGIYQITRQLGVGGMGVVYEAVDRTLERKVAIKKMREEIRADPRERERFLHEARTVAAMHHPNIVEIYSIVEDGSDVYLVFEHVDGRTVHDLIQADRALSFGKALEILRGACAALDYAHRHNVIHRDLKPSNIMIDREGKVKVMDFGVARLAKDSLSRLSMTNTVVGTPPYMAPEQEQGIVRKESDLYALAVCLYEMVTGQLPFNGIGAGMLLAKLNKTYTPASRVAPDLPKGFDDIMARALDPEPDKRWRTPLEFLQDISALAKAS